MFIAHDVEINKNGELYRVRDNPITGQKLEVVEFDVQGSEKELDFNEIERINGRFLNSSVERYKKATMVVRYSVSKIAYASHLKNSIQNLFSGQFYLREMAANDIEIPFQTMLDPTHEFELNYVDGKQLLVTLVSNVSFDTTKTDGIITLEFETVELPYYESIGYSTDLESGNNLDLWGMTSNMTFISNRDQRKFTFYNTDNDFVYYAGDIPINQFNQKLTVEIIIGENTNHFTFDTGYKSEMMTIKNIDLKEGDVIKFDGIQTYKNGIPINGKKYGTGNQPSLIPGYNQFHFNQVVNKVVFKFKMYYR
ncbi:phage tail domain-containing protein [Staphylococcus xylosus]|uniref:phage tail domain-containing protein n=1 Tax=Staphylococcus xylosus TaxID=1288 RepID=UPI001E37EF36|nr:phage tail domain-containing protein [Staphylococcus xylosus]MCD8851633.1 phage tail family protein [Staphylococcus xylosus]